MENMVNVFLFGKKYEVPGESDDHGARWNTRAISWCAAAAAATASAARARPFTASRAISELKACLACSDAGGGRHVCGDAALLPAGEAGLRYRKGNAHRADHDAALSRNLLAASAATPAPRAATQGLNVMQYIAYAQRGEYEKCAEQSFDCVMCGICSSRCPAGISHPQVAMLARRLNGKYIAPEVAASDEARAGDRGRDCARKLHRGHHGTSRSRSSRSSTTTARLKSKGAAT